MEEIKEIKLQINKLNQKLENLRRKKKYIPNNGDTYYIVSDCGDIQSYKWENDTNDNWRYLQRNCFKTYDLAMQHFENLKTEAELFLLAEKLNDKRIIDWDNKEQAKFYIYLEVNGKKSKLKLRFNNNYMTQGTIYCLNRNFLNEAKQIIGNDRLIRLFQKDD